MIVRFAHANDSRQVVVQMTEQGTTEIDHIRKKVLEYTVRMLENIGANASAP